ncbi:hypothetical protein [Candidatus Poriferisodalis sp.]
MVVGLVVPDGCGEGQYPCGDAGADAYVMAFTTHAAATWPDE